MKLLTTLLFLFCLLISVSCNSPTREMFFNAGVDYAFDQLQKAHPGGTIKAALPKNSFELYQTPWGFLDYRIIIVKDSASKRDSIIIPYHINYPTIKDTAKNFIKKLLNKKKMKNNSLATTSLLNTKFWLLEQAFLNRMSPIVMHRLKEHKGVWLGYKDNDEEMNDDEEDYDSDWREHDKLVDGVKIIQVKGTMSPRGDFSARGVKGLIKDLKKCAEDPQVKAIVFDVNSHGGMAESIQELYNYIYNYPKPTVAIANDNMHSAAYYGFCGCDFLYCNTENTSFVGSIGVYMMHVDYSIADEINGYKVTYITSEKSTEKVIGNPHTALSDSDYSFLEAEANELHEAFIRDVNRARSRNTGLDAQVFTGRSFSGIKAKDLGLIDAVGTLDQAILKAKNLAMSKTIQTNRFA